MKTMLKVAALVCLLVPFAYGAPTWTTIPSVATNCPNAAQWTADNTDFVPDFDASPDGYLYLKLWYAAGGTRWDFNTNDFGAGGYTYVFRVLPNLPVDSYYSQWEQVLRYSANNEGAVSTCKRNGAFIGANFGAMQHNPLFVGGWDWSWISYFTTNDVGVPTIPGVNVNGVASAWDPGNKHPYAVSYPSGFATYESFSNYVAVSISGDQTGDAIANIEARVVAGRKGWGTANTIARKATDGKYVRWQRGMSYKGNTYVWKGPNSANTLDGIWVVTNVVGNSDLVSLSQCVSNAYNLVPVSTMGAGADTWDTSAACGIVAFGPTENMLGKDLVVVSANVDGGNGSILAFDLANPTSGPVTLWGVSNIVPSGAEATKLQLGKAGRYLFVISGDTAATRTMYRLDMGVPEPATALLGVAGLLLALRRR